MKINFSAPICDLDDKPIMISQSGDRAPQPMTLGDVAAEVLQREIPGQGGQPENISGTEKWRRGKLAYAIHNAKEPLDISVNDVALIKDRIGLLCMPLTVMRAFDLLDPSED